MTIKPREGANFYMLHTGLGTRYKGVGNKYQQKSKVKNQQQEKRKRVHRQQEKPSNKRKEMSSPATRKNPVARNGFTGNKTTACVGNHCLVHRVEMVHLPAGYIVTYLYSLI